MFETTDKSKPLTLNYRPIQPLNGRIVKARTVDKSFINLTPPKWNHNSKRYGKLNNDQNVSYSERRARKKRSRHTEMGIELLGKEKIPTKIITYQKTGRRPMLQHLEQSLYCKRLSEQSSSTEILIQNLK